MRKTAYQDHILYTVVSSIAIAFQQSGESFQKIFRIIPCSPGLIIIKNDGREAIISCEIDPHIGGGSRRPPLLMENLTDSLIRMEEVTLDKIFM